MLYKTLHRIRLRFYWHKLRADVEAWLKSCPDCILANSTVRRNSELVYSWPVSSPFAILHVNIWQPGNVTSYSGSKYILGVMCNLTTFAIIADLDSIDSATLAATFMKDILLKIGLCLLVAPDAGSPFKKNFVDMCKALRLWYFGCECAPPLLGVHSE